MKNKSSVPRTTEGVIAAAQAEGYNAEQTFDDDGKPKSIYIPLHKDMKPDGSLATWNKGNPTIPIDSYDTDTNRTSE